MSRKKLSWVFIATVLVVVIWTLLLFRYTFVSSKRAKGPGCVGRRASREPSPRHSWLTNHRQ